MKFYLSDLRLVKPYMEELKESNPERYGRIVKKYNYFFKNMTPDGGKGPTMDEFLKDIFCDT